jgi:hypothetical protein
MPFDEDENSDALPNNKKGLKKVSTQKSMFEEMPKKPSQEDFEHRVKNIQEKESNYKAKASDLSSKFVKMLSDRTLKQNKNIFSVEMEREVLSQMVNLAIDINSDIHENEGMGSMGWITLLLKICLYQRDRMNQLEYEISVLNKKCDPATITTLMSKELQALDKKKNSE